MIRILHDCKTELREHDLKATPARLAVLQLFETINKPLDMEAIIDYLEKEGIESDPVTAFRIVNIFTEKGLTRRIQLQEGKFRYELASMPDHHHLVCAKCGGIQDISDCNISLLEKEIREKKGFVVTNHALEFFGICERCMYK